MSGLTMTVTVRQELRPALLRKKEAYQSKLTGMLAFRFSGEYERVLVHPFPSGEDGLIVIEYDNGRCGTAKPSDLRFIDSEDRFEAVCWDVPED